MKRIICGKCKNPYPVNSCEVRKCPHPAVRASKGEYICVYCCKSCKFVYQQNTGFGCSYGKEVTQ
jgi:hypothetical protein